MRSFLDDFAPIIVVFVTFILCVGFVILVVRSDKPFPCSAYADYATKDVPIRCIKELTK